MKTDIKIIIAVFLLGFISFSTPSAFSTEIYKWTDKDGRIIFSDTPPSTGVEPEIKKFEEPQSKEKPKPKDNSSPAQTGCFTTIPGRDGNKKTSTGISGNRETKSTNNLSQFQERSFQREAVL